MTQIELLRASIKMSAAVSECGRFRWSLERWWGTGNRHVVFVMCNPSRADHQQNDPTLLNCIHFAKSWGYDGLKVVNLFPYRSSLPTDCKNWYTCWDLRGAWDVRDAMQENLLLVTQVTKAADMVVAAWGNISWGDGIVDQAIEEITTNEEPWPDLYCLGTTKDGSPKHPLARGKHRVPRDQQPILWKKAN